MSKRMLIDAAHPEEIRVAILNGTRLEEFDVETAIKRQIKGNIYLARVTRVEPSLQAAFVEYGGNRHGFLAFNEIHPDYYRIPVSDRAAFESVYDSRRHAESEHETEADERAAPPAQSARSMAESPSADSGSGAEPSDRALEPPAQAAAHGDSVIYDTLRPDTAEGEVADMAAAPLAAPEPQPDTDPEPEPAHRDDTEPGVEAAPGDAAALAPFPSPRNEDAAAMPTLEIAPPGDGGDADDAGDGLHQVEIVTQVQTLETVGGDESEEEEAEEAEEAPRPRFRSHRHYKIQEVIKRRQIMLVQVTKEERGNKGAALTTYLSLAGRYCVLMPNTPRGGGVSRKITSMQDRRRLKDLMSDLQVPDGMGVIVRTAGSERSKPEIKRDFEYLMRLWDEIRELTLKSTAPALVYEEGNLIKRAIRDLYSRDIEEIVVDGDADYRAAKSFMKMLMPSHAKRVKPYSDPTVPLFHRYQAEGQIDAILSPVVQLRSGGYIVINPTEALVAIDVNSGRATRERNIEETALKTNLEAAEEVARQLRLRDLAGLIVIDFIDMEDQRNNSQVERRVKESMRHDRARIQIGRISPFGLMELSRQRLRPSVLEASTEPCPHCGGTGHIRSTDSTALQILRAIEEEGMHRRTAEISVALPTDAALYLLNRKREALGQTEKRYGLHVILVRDDTLVAPAFRLERGRPLTPEEIAALPPSIPVAPVEEDEEEIVAEDEGEAEAADIEPPSVAGPPVFAEADEEREAEVEAAPRRHRNEEPGSRRRHRRHRGEGRGRHEERHRGDGPAEPRPPHEANFAPASGGEAEDAAASVAGEAAEGVAAPAHVPHHDGEGEMAGDHKRRRRGRRGGRRRRREPGEGGSADAAPAEPGRAPMADGEAPEPMAVALAPVMEATDAENFGAGGVDQDIDIAAEMAPAAEPAPRRPLAAEAEAVPAAASTHQPTAQPEPEPKSQSERAPEPEPAGPLRRGWWRRR
jgi:ribonuclease E